MKLFRTSMILTILIVTSLLLGTRFEFKPTPIFSQDEVPDLNGPPEPVESNLNLFDAVGDPVDERKVESDDSLVPEEAPLGNQPPAVAIPVPFEATATGVNPLLVIELNGQRVMWGNILEYINHMTAEIEQAPYNYAEGLGEQRNAVEEYLYDQIKEQELQKRKANLKIELKKVPHSVREVLNGFLQSKDTVVGIAEREAEYGPLDAELFVRKGPVLEAEAESGVEEVPFELNEPTRDTPKHNLRNRRSMPHEREEQKLSLDAELEALMALKTSLFGKLKQLDTTLKNALPEQERLSEIRETHKKIRDVEQEIQNLTGRRARTTDFVVMGPNDNGDAQPTPIRSPGGRRSRESQEPFQPGLNFPENRDSFSRPLDMENNRHIEVRVGGRRRAGGSSAEPLQDDRNTRWQASPERPFTPEFAEGRERQPEGFHRVMQLRQAAELLEQAGEIERARELFERAEELERDLDRGEGARRQHEPAALEEVLQQMRELHEQIHDLRQDVREIRELLRREHEEAVDEESELKESNGFPGEDASEEGREETVPEI
ncbi:MAG: hypothetical protein KDA65_01775 [Planctomycetaceae bacterium]|nr:hypothetical protein [Planctomycetaceae bacterium]